MTYLKLRIILVAKHARVEQSGFSQVCDSSTWLPQQSACLSILC